MKTITVRDLRQRWPAAERLLQTEREPIVTRDGQPIARLVQLATTKVKPNRFDPQKHAKWQRRVLAAGTTLGWVQTAIEQGRRAFAWPRCRNWSCAGS